jgi:hypothetical protein
MAYIGKEPTTGNFIYADDITTSATNTYNILVGGVAFSPESANHLIVSLNGVIQKANTSFSVSGSQITFIPSSGTLSSSDSIDFILILGSVNDVGVATTVSDSAITKSKLNLISTSGSPGIEIKGDGSSENGTIQLNCSQNSHGVKISSPAHSAGQSYELILPTGNVTADKVLKVASVSGSGTTGIGQLSFGDAGANNQPCFLASKSDSNQSVAHNTTTKITFNNEIVDSDNAFASSTFTVPSGEGGTYFLSAGIYVGSSQDYNYLSIRKNGSSTNVMNFTTFKNNTSDNTYHVSSLVSASASDTFEVYYSQSKGSAVNVESNSSVGFTFFGGFKVV